MSRKHDFTCNDLMTACRSTRSDCQFNESSSASTANLPTKIPLAMDDWNESNADIECFAPNVAPSGQPHRWYARDSDCVASGCTRNSNSGVALLSARLPFLGG